MADPVAKTGSVAIATLKTLMEKERGQGKAGLERTSDLRPDPKTIERYDNVVARLAEETKGAGANVLIAVGDRDASVLQSQIAEHGDAGPPKRAGAIEAQFGEGLTGGDLWGWLSSLFDHIDASKAHPIVRPADAVVGHFAESGHVAVVSDWGTNLYGAPVSAASIRRAGGYEMLLHLGDIYYSGTDTETRQRFLGVWPTEAGKLSRALNGNHEMYSGGYAYFDHILPAFRQPSSYFAMQNAHWLLVGLDTAHTDHALDAEQVAWLKTVVQSAAQRKVLLFSHHQPFSPFDTQGPQLQAALADLLQQRAITAWYWGHEHQCIVYDRHPQFGLLGRCIGHGGVPAPRKREVMDAPVERNVGGIAWHRLDSEGEVPSSLVLDGPNPLIPGEEEKFGPHGYLTLAFDGPRLVERIHLPDGVEIFQAEVA